MSIRKINKRKSNKNTLQSNSFPYVVVRSLIFIGDITRSCISIPALLFISSYKYLVKHYKYLFASKKILSNKKTQKKSVKKVQFSNLYRTWLRTIIKKTLKISRVIKTSYLIPKANIHVPPIPSISLPKLSSPIHTGGDKNKPRTLRIFLYGIITSFIVLFLPLVSIVWLRQLPNPNLLSRRDLEVSTKIFDRNGILLYEIYADQNRNPLPLSSIPDHIKEATIAIEDRDFYRHNGVSLRGIIRAAKEILVKNRIQGGSTITQQLIKSALLTPDVKLSRKIKEIILAFWAERIYSKDEILEMYLNQVPYGGIAWGIEAASQTYFGKSAKQLSLSEATLLAGLPAAPTEYSPYGSHPEKAMSRQNEVLNKMVEDRYITQTQANNARKDVLTFIPQRVSIQAPHFVMYVKEILEKKYGPRLVERGGLRIITSLDLSIQEQTEEIVRQEIASLSALDVTNGATIITNPKTGEILSMVGSTNYFDIENDGNVNVTTSLRPPGSTIKIVNYAAALESKQFTAASILHDTPVVYKSLGTKSYAPKNYDSKFHGPTPLRYALANSYNVPAVKVLNAIGVQTMIKQGQKMGIRSWDDESRYGLSLTLGGGDVTMLELVQVFGSLANSGVKTDLVSILQISDYTGKILETQRSGKQTRALSKESAWILSHILSDNKARSKAFGSQSSLVIPKKTVSVKTGTSNDKRDNWTVGYTPSYVVAVWVGNNDNSPMHPLLSSGLTGASTIWNNVMKKLLQNVKDESPTKPQEITGIPCYYGRIEYFIKGTEPKNGKCGPLPSAKPTISPTITP